MALNDSRSGESSNPSAHCCLTAVSGKLAEWLRDWDNVVLRGKKKEVPAVDPKQKFQPAPENLNARAVLVSGPPGIGKTTTCTLVAKCSNYKVMEFNASDARSKAVIDSMTNSLAGSLEAQGVCFFRDSSCVSWWAAPSNCAVFKLRPFLFMSFTSLQRHPRLF